MSPPSVWGPPIWLLFHTLAEKIHEDQYNKLIPTLFMFIKRICMYLPCPECSQHATTFLSKVKPEHISNKNDFKNMFFVFHNSVNKRKNKSQFNYCDLERYKHLNIIFAFNNFITVYNTKGNMRLLAESFQRHMIIKNFKKWLVDNIDHFK